MREEFESNKAKQMVTFKEKEVEFKALLKELDQKQGQFKEKQDKIDALIHLLEPMGIKKLARSGILALYREPE